MISLLSYLWSFPIAISITICVSVSFIIYRYVKPKEDVWKVQGLKTVSAGNVFERFRKELYRVEHDIVLKGGKLFGTTSMSKPLLYCSEPELIRDILSKDFHIFTNRKIPKTGNRVWDESLLVVDDDQWKRIRSIMSPTFSTGKLRRMKPLIDDCIKTMIENFENVIKSKESECDVREIFGAFSIDVVISVAFGTKVNSLIDENNPIIVNVKKFMNRDFQYKTILKILLMVCLPKLAQKLQLSFFDNGAANFFKQLLTKIIDERKNENKNVKRYDFLQLMIEAIENRESEVTEPELKDDLSNEEIKFVTHNKTLTSDEFTAQCVLFFFAGYDTTATTLSYAAYNLALNPDVQEKLYDEAKHALQSNTEIDYDIVHSLKYLDAVISESLRLFPPITVSARIASENYTLGNTGFTVPKDAIIAIPIYSIHHDADNFPDPESFKPERFFPENRNHHTYAYMPFGNGPRNCIAKRLALMEVKMALINAVYRFKFSVSENTEIPPKCYTGVQLLVPKCVTLKVERRL